MSSLDSTIIAECTNLAILTGRILGERFDFLRSCSRCSTQAVVR